MSDADLPQCDIVMKGGVTRGVVYPAAVAAIAKRFRFRSIGGTSAGAIAAVVTAAAELQQACCDPTGSPSQHDEDRCQHVS
jgi:predicted acylesterase/phospholipase RssA